MPVDFTVERAKSFAFSIKVQFEDETPFPLDGTVARLTIAQPRRMGGAVVLTELGVDLDVDGVRQFQLQAADLDLAPGEYPYDITLVTAEDYSVPLAKGSFIIGSNVDTVDTNVYDFSDPAQWITFTIKNGATIRTVLSNTLALGSVWLGGAPGTLAPTMLEAIQDAVAAMLLEGDNVSLDYDDGAGTLTVSSTGGGGGGGSFSGYNPIYALAYED
jgi:hypothetical protein